MPRVRRGIGWSLIAVATLFYGIDIADRFNVFAAPAPLNIPLDWGTGNNNFWMTVNEKTIVKYKNTYKLMMIGYVPAADADRMTDPRISKSTLYTITGGTEELLSVPLSNKLGEGLPPGNYLIQLICALIPNGFSVEQISSLGDITKVGGIFAGARGVNGLTRALVHPIAPTAPPHQ